MCLLYSLNIKQKVCLMYHNWTKLFCSSREECFSVVQRTSSERKTNFPLFKCQLFFNCWWLVQTQRAYPLCCLGTHRESAELPANPWEVFWRHGCWSSRDQYSRRNTNTDIKIELLRKRALFCLILQLRFLFQNSTWQWIETGDNFISSSSLILYIKWFFAICKSSFFSVEIISR